jgi:predicted GH43/DUF377 family glycosyl hydrolase
VLGYGADGQWDDYSARGRAIINDGDTLKMWYLGQDAHWDAGGISRIGYAWSLDGTSWNRHPGNPVMSAELAWEGEHVGTGPVIKDGDTLRMWYGTKLDYWLGALGYATSVDGIHWTRHPDSVFQAGPSDDWDSEIAFCSAVKEDSGYKMWYSGRSGTGYLQIGLATSTDGIHWAKYDDPVTTDAPFAESDPVLKVDDGAWDYNRVFVPEVLPTATGYEMWYTGAWYSTPAGNIQVIGYATSTDGISWEKWPTNPIIRSYPAWGYYYQTGPVLQYGGLYHMWYASFDAAGSRGRVGYATSLQGLVDIAVAPSTYCTPSSDTVEVTVLFTGDTTGMTLFAEFEASDGTTLDSIRLYDDGAHSDGDANDSLFGNAWPVPLGEQLYFVGLQARLNDAEIINYDDLSRFTTVGPVVYDGITIVSSEPILYPGETMYFHLQLENSGSTATAADIEATLSSNSECVSSLTKIARPFGDIPPGESATNGTRYVLIVDASCPGDCDIPLYISIASEGQTWWSDSLHIHVGTLDIAVEGEALPERFALRQNYPNPFNPVSTIRYELPRGGDVRLVVYDILGREVVRLVDGTMEAGYHEEQWNGRNRLGSEVPSGIYIARLVTTEYSKTIKMVLLK